MLSRIIYIILGIIVIYVGYDVMKSEFFHYYGIYIYLGRGKYSVGIGCVIVGISLIWIACRKKFSSITEKKYMKCKKCMNTYAIDDIPNTKCPNCGDGLEDLEGFYERHPELKAR